MTVHNQPPNPRNLEADDLADVLQAARHTRGMVAGDGLTSDVGRGGARIALDGATMDQAGIRQSFFAEIAPKGPPPTLAGQPFPTFNDPAGAADFSDARYWVREVADVTGRQHPATTAPRFRRADELRHALFKAEVPAVRRVRWLPATNVAELGVGGDAHAVPVGEIVRVYAALNQMGRWFHWFARNTGGENTRFGVVRDTFNASVERDIVIVQEVRQKNPLDVCFNDPTTVLQHPDEDARRTFCQTAAATFAVEWEFSGEAGPVAVWPNLKAVHYEAFRFSGETIVPRVQVLPVDRINGIWYVRQLPRWRIHKLPITARITDCSLVQFVAGLLGRKS